MLLRHARYLVAIADQAISRAARCCMSRSPRCRSRSGSSRTRCARRCSTARAVLVPLEFALPERTAVLLQRKGAYRTAAARAFVALETDWARERHGVTPAFALISRPVTPLFLGFRCELAAPLQRDRPARIAWLQPPAPEVFMPAFTAWPASLPRPARRPRGRNRQL